MARVSQAQEARVHWRSMRKRPRQEVEKQRGGWNLEVDARGAWRPSDWTDPLAILPGRLVYGLELGPFRPFNFPRPASAANLPFRSLTPPPRPRDRIPEHCSTRLVLLFPFEYCRGSGAPAIRSFSSSFRVSRGINPSGARVSADSRVLASQPGLPSGQVCWLCLPLTPEEEKGRE